MFILDYVWDDDILHTLSNEMQSSINKQQQHLKHLASLSSRHHSTLSLPVSASTCGSVTPHIRGSPFLSVDNVAQHNVTTGHNTGSTHNSVPDHNAGIGTSKQSVPAIVIGDNAMVDYNQMEVDGGHTKCLQDMDRGKANSLQDNDVCRAFFVDLQCTYIENRALGLRLWPISDDC